MKKLLSILLLLSMMLTMLTSLSACNSFPGGKEGFSLTNDFYTKVGNTIFSLFAGKNSFIPFLNDKTLALDAGLSLSDYKINGEIIGNGDVNFDASLMVDNEFDYDYTIDFHAFGIDYYKQCIQSRNEMYINYGDLVSKPMYYSGSGFNVFQYAVEGIKSIASDAEYISGEESYKFNGVNFETETVAFSINTNAFNELAMDISNKLYFDNNKVYNEWHYTFNELMYFIDKENIHLTWKRYFDGDELCRESIKIHDNNNHNVTLEIIFASDDDVDYAELSVKGYDGSVYFDIFSINAVKTVDGNDFSTEGKVLIGDEILITASNEGNATKANGSASINYMTNMGEISIPATFSYVGEGEGEEECGLGLKQKLDISVNGLSISFDGTINLYGRLTDNEPQITKPESYYDLGSLENQYYFASIGEAEKNNAIGAMFDALLGENIYYTPIDGDIDEEFKYQLDIFYDKEKTFETDGKYGEKYVNALMSDEYTYKYSFHSNEEGFPTTNVTIYKDGDKKMYHYNYQDGTVYGEYFEGAVKNEIRHDIKKIIYTDYGEQFDDYFSETTYIYYESGYCRYENRELVYEKYYDFGNNRYTFIFDESGEVEIVVVNNNDDYSTLYTFVTEISQETPTNAFELPDYDRVSVQDFFE